MKRTKCTFKDCPNDAITFSENCGQHTSNRKVISALKNYKEKSFAGIFLSDVEIKTLTFNNKIFSNCQILDVEFLYTHFVNCIFKDCYLSNVHFIDVTFERSNFVNCDFHNCEFEHCSFEVSMFSTDTFIECSFYENTLIRKSSFVDALFIGSTIDEECDFNGTEFTKTKIYQSSISDSDFSESSLVACEFRDVILFKNDFRNSTIQSLTHDFGLGSFPKLNDFSSATIIDTTIQRNIKEWNLFKGKQEKFLMNIVEKIYKERHPNNLMVLTKALELLEQFGYNKNAPFINKINSLFRNQFERATSNGDYRTIGEIISEYGRIPVSYRITGFALPAPKSMPFIKGHEASLTIQFKMDIWTVQNVHQLLLYISELEKMLPIGNSPLEVSDILKGSIFATLWGDFKQIGYAGRLLDIEKLEIEVEHAQIKKELDRIELERQKEIIKTHKKENKLRLKKMELENENIELELMQKKINILTSLEKLQGIDYIEFVETYEGKKAKRIALDLGEVFPIESLKMKILKK